MPVNPNRKYQLTTPQYAELYGVSESTAARYRAEHAPLDDPNAMPAWIAANRRQTPKRIRFEKVEDQAPIEQGLILYAGPRDQVHDVEADVEIVPPKIGARAEIEALELECAKARKLYSDNRTNPLLGPIYLKTWTSLANTLRQLSKDTPGSEDKDKKSILIETVEASLTQNLLEIKNQLELIPLKIRKGCEHIDNDTMIEVELIVQREIAYTIKTLHSAPWLTTE